MFICCIVYLIRVFLFWKMKYFKEICTFKIMFILMLHQVTNTSFKILQPITIHNKFKLCAKYTEKIILFLFLNLLFTPHVFTTDIKSLRFLIATVCVCVRARVCHN